jgi:hypothetical protein
MRKPILPRKSGRLGALGILLTFTILVACESGSSPLSASLTGSDPGTVGSSDDDSRSRDDDSRDSNSGDSNSGNSNSGDSNSRDSNSRDSNSRDSNSRDG